MNKQSSLYNIRFASGCLHGNSSTPPVKPRNNHHYNTHYQLAKLIVTSTLTSDLNNGLSPSGKNYDYLLKFLLVGDSDVGKEEILNGLIDDNATESDTQFCGSPGVAYKSTIILLDGKRIKIQLWDTSGQGRFSTIIRSYSRGAQGILLVYDITNKWSFSGLNRWLQEVEEHAPGVPKILLGNRLHLAFKRQVNAYTAENYAQKHNMSFFEVSPLCNYNIRESFAELSRIVLQRHGMESFWRHNTVFSLKELCCRSIVSRTTVYAIEQLPLPNSLKSYLKSYSSLKSYSYSKNKYFYPQKYSHCNKNKELNVSLKKKAKALITSMFRLST